MCGRLAKELEQQTSVMSEISQAKYALEFQKSRLATGLKRSGAMDILLNLHVYLRFFTGVEHLVAPCKSGRTRG